MQASVAAVLCVVMLAPMPAEAAADKQPNNPKNPTNYSQVGNLAGDERILQALNRLTWGPRPGDVEQVRAMGLDRWIDQQLNPAELNDSATENAMQNFPALQLTPAQMVLQFPDNNIAKLAQNGQAAMPTDPNLQAVYRNAIARYQQQAAKKQAAQQSAAQNLMHQNAPQKNMAQDAMAQDAGSGNSMNAASATNTTNASNATKAPPDVDSSGVDSTEEKILADLEATSVLNLPPDQRLARLIAMQPEELNDFRSRLSQSERMDLAQGMTPSQREIVASLENPIVVVGSELMQAKLLRSIETSRQLEDVMTDFWLNHFNVYIKKGQPEPYYIASFERDVLRPNALGKFEDLLVATAKSPAMLFYLDNWSSVGPDSPAVQRARLFAAVNGNADTQVRGLNENYARELMELHTLGVDGGYTQQDVTQVARVFTGWTIDKPQMGGGYLFDERRHEPGSKVVLGQTIAENGEQEGLQVLHMLAVSPATAHHVSFEIAQRFVSDDPPKALVDRMAQSWLASNGDIRSVLKTMLRSPEFWSTDVYRAKVKTPLEYVISAVRASGYSGAPVTSALPLVVSLEKLDMPLFGQQPPTGYSTTADHWVSSSALLNRMNFALYLASGRMPGVETDWSGLIAESIAAPQQVAELNAAAPNGRATHDGGATILFDASEWQPSDNELRLETLLLGKSASPQTHEAILQEMLNQTVQDPNAIDKQFPLRQNLGGPAAVVGGAVTLPEAAQMTSADRQLGMMAGLLLGSPEFQRK
jgi:uncharacterized protein (DUF1800 family)